MTSPITSTAQEKRNARRFVWAQGLQSIGDQIVAAKTVLPWLLQSAGAPAFFIGLLVPIRESGSMLPQASLTPWVTSRAQRKGIWVMGGIGQAMAAALMAVAALLLEGTPLAVAILVLLAVLALCRALCSIASKDVQGRTISKGSRGQITGRATELGGAAALLVGVGLWFLTGDIDLLVIVALIAAAALSWVVASAIFWRIEEPVEDAEQSESNKNAGMADAWRLFTGNADFRAFVIARGLLLVTALSTSFIVVLGQGNGSDLGGLAAFVVASGLSALIGGRISGMWSDVSSKNVMSYGALVGSILLFVLVACAAWLPEEVNAWVFPVGFLLVNLTHTAVRVGRKTYIVDMAEGDDRTRYVGAANTLMGFILLGVGAISGGLAMLGPAWALIFLAFSGLAGVMASRNLKDVSA
ncbi:MFS transporter [Corynebacterium sp.]|uniref:MFS transporter n=1 Tax=Corynebacterium sp. TaxID=1720 RepID=UPI0026DC2A1B|nr:MFS transporter [Corynebacterium sp.]MDO5031906.1 MFS transporter [Corynebacterium sp.]